MPINKFQSRYLHHVNNAISTPHLKRTLGPVMLWGLGVGYVISGMYTGWNLGLPIGGTLGMALATAVIIVLYVTFTFSYAELACAIPKAGGVFDYANRALGPRWGFVGGMAQNIEFLFAPPAIAAAIGAYFHLLLPSVPVNVTAITAFVLFTGLNIYGVRAAAIFELVITILAVAELLVFAGATLPHFKAANMVHHSWPNGWQGAFGAIPFAVWLFLGIEGVANVAEEAINPQRNVLIGFGSAIFTLVLLCVITFCGAVGVYGWEAIVYTNGIGGDTSDSPLPLALRQVTANSPWMYHLLIGLGLMGLVASFHGLLLAAGRSTYEFGRSGYAPKILGNINATTSTPAMALLFNMVVGIIALLSGKTDQIITISCFGALSLYIVAMIVLLVLRSKEPLLVRPFKVPMYPLFPIAALIIALISIIAVTVYNPLQAAIYIALLAVSYLYFHFFVEKGTIG